MSDLISRDDLKKAIHNFFDGKVIDEPAYILRDVFCYIDSAPVVAAIPNEEGYEMYSKGYLQGYERGKKERLQGEWIHNGINAEGMDIYRCSICNRLIVTWSARINEYPYCHCGAKMKGGAE